MPVTVKLVLDLRSTTMTDEQRRMARGQFAGAPAGATAVLWIDPDQSFDECADYLRRHNPHVNFEIWCSDPSTARRWRQWMDEGYRVGEVL